MLVTIGISHCFLVIIELVIIGFYRFSGIGMGLFSYNGRVRASMIGDAAALPDPSDIPNLVQEFENEIIELTLQNNLSLENVFCGDDPNNNNCK